jgi:membrane protein YqaA with SNARE-associated domain
VGFLFLFVVTQIRHYHNPKGTTMSDTATTVAAASNKASQKAINAVAAASETLPTVVEVAEHAIALPTKVVLNQRLIVVVTAVGSAAVGAGVLWGVNRLRAVRAQKRAERQAEEILENVTGTSAK